MTGLYQVMAIKISAKPDNAAPNNQTPLRLGRLRTLAATNNCGNNTPDSRIGTKKPTSAEGAPKAPINQGKMSFALASSSATFPKKLAIK